MHRLDHVAFRIAAVTNITHEHLDFHGTVDGYRRAKAQLVAWVGGTGGTVIVNADDPGAQSVLPSARGAEIIRFSMTGAGAELSANRVAVAGSGSRFVLRARDFGEVDVRLPLLGEFNVANALCAAGVALAAGPAWRQ